MRVSRQFRDLMNRKCFGFGHDMEVKPGAGQLALFCPACPQPGINMPLSWQDKYPRQVMFNLNTGQLRISAGGASTCSRPGPAGRLCAEAIVYGLQLASQCVLSGGLL